MAQRVHDGPEVTDGFAVEDPQRHDLQLLDEGRDRGGHGAAVTEQVLAAVAGSDRAIPAEARACHNVDPTAQARVSRIDAAVDDDHARARHHSSTT